MLQRLSKLFVFGSLCLLFYSFQNCSRVDHSGSTPATKSGGDPYGGMRNKIFRSYSSVQPCTSLDLNGSPLPNAMINFKADQNSSASPYLTRQNCQDIGPLAINAADLQSVNGSDTSFTYKTQTFSTANPPGAFDILKPACPSGKTAIAGANGPNLAAAPLDWTVRWNGAAGSGWDIYTGISANLFGSIQGLPSFTVQRNNPNELEYWRLMEQDFTTLKANTDYAFSFLVQPGTVNAVDFLYRRCVGTNCGDSPAPGVETATIMIDLQTLTTSNRWAPYGVSNVSAVVSPLGSAFAVTVYWTSSATDNQPGNNIQIGVTPSTLGQTYGQLGDSIVTTAAELVEVANFCQ